MSNPHLVSTWPVLGPNIDRCITNPKCALCLTPQLQPTTNHRCSVALVQGRYTWMHDSVMVLQAKLQVFVHGLQKHLPDFKKLYADFPGYLASVSPPSTIPTELSISLSRPDLVLVSKDSIYLTIPSNTYWLQELIDMAIYCMIFNILG